MGGNRKGIGCGEGISVTGGIKISCSLRLGVSLRIPFFNFLFLFCVYLSMRRTSLCCLIFSGDGVIA